MRKFAPLAALRTVLAALIALGSLGPIVYAGVGHTDTGGNCGCDEAAGSTWSPGQNVARNQIDTLSVNTGLGPAVGLHVEHDPMLDWDRDFDDAGGADIAHEFPITIAVGATDWRGAATLLGVSAWSLIIDWNRDGVFDETALESCSGQDFNLVDQMTLTDVGGEWGSTYEPFHHGAGDSRVSSFTIATKLPQQSPTSRRAFSYKLTTTVDLDFNPEEEGVDYPVTNTIYGIVYLPTFCDWTSDFGADWMGNYERHLEFYPATDEGDTLVYEDGGDPAPVVVWVKQKEPLAFEYDPEGAGPWNSVPYRESFGDRYVLTQNELTVGGVEETLIVLHEYGSGNREYYYPDLGADPTSGKLRALKDAYGNTVVFDYDGYGKLETITNASGNQWRFTYDTDTVEVAYYEDDVSNSPLATATFHKDSEDRLDYWIAPEHQALEDVHTQDFTYPANNAPEFDTFLRNRITQKTGYGVAQVDYTYDTESSNDSYGFLLSYKRDDNSDLTTSYAYEWAETAPTGTRSQKRVLISRPGGPSHPERLFVTADGHIWKNESAYEDSSEKLVTEHWFYYYDWDSGSAGVSNYLPGVTMYKNGSGDVISQSASSHYWTYAPVQALRSGRPIEVVSNDGRQTLNLYDDPGCPEGAECETTGIYATAHLDHEARFGNSDQTYYTWEEQAGGDAFLLDNTETVGWTQSNLVTEYTYNEKGQLLDVTQPGAATCRSYEYYDGSDGAPAGLLKKVKDEAVNDSDEGNTTRYGYDWLARTTYVKTLDTGSDVKSETDYDYNPDNTIATVTEKGETENEDIVTDYTYDAGKRLLRATETSNGGNYNKYEYFSFGDDHEAPGALRYEKRCDSGDSCVTYKEYAYDLAGHVTDVIDGNSRHLYNTYDGRGRLIHVGNCDDPPCDGDPHWNESRDYTPDSRVTHVSWDNEIGSHLVDANDIYYGYDEFDRLARVTTKLGAGATPWRHIVYTYEDDVDQRPRVVRKDIYKDANSTFAGNEAVEDFYLTYTFPAAPGYGDEYMPAPDAKVTMHVPGSYYDATFDHKYNTDGSLATRCEDMDVYGNCSSGSRTDFTYYPNHWLRSIEHSRGELDLPTFKFGWYSSAFSLPDGYDNNGNRLHIRESFGATNYDYTYTYDMFSRLLTSATTVNGDVDVDYVYDDAGNITSKTRDAAETGYTLNYKNQVTLADATSDTYFCYDGAGNMSYEGASISCPPNSGQQTHWWDYRDRLVQWKDAKFAYDPSSQRIVENNGDVFYYLWDGGNPIAKYDSDGNAVEFYLYGSGADNLIAKWDVASEKRYDYFRDGVNSVARVVNASDDTIDAVYRYEPYGSPQPSSDALVDRYAYTGREACEVDGHTTLYYRARWYDADIGRFLSRDPLDGRPDAPRRYQRYAYVAGNPVNSTDPDGLRTICTQSEIIGPLSALAYFKLECSECETAGDPYIPWWSTLDPLYTFKWITSFNRPRRSVVDGYTTGGRMPKLTPGRWPQIPPLPPPRWPWDPEATVCVECTTPGPGGPN